MNKKANGFPVKIFIALILIGSVGNYVLCNTQGLFYVSVSAHFGITRTAFSLYYTVQCIGAVIGSAFAGKIYNEHKEKMAVFFGAAVVVQVVGYVLFSTAQNVIIFYVVGFFLGIAGTFDTMMLVGLLVSNWFSKKNGFILGLVSALSSMLGAVCATTMTSLATSAWRTGYLVVAIVTAVCLLPCVFLIKYSPDLVGRKPWGADEVAKEADTAMVSNTGGVAYTAARRSPAFYLCFLVMFCAISYSCFTYAIPGYVASIGFDVAVTGLCVSAYMIGGMAGKLVVGWLNDAIGFTKALILTVVVGVIGMLMLIFSKGMPSAVPIIGAVFYGVAMAAAAVFPPVITKQCFGLKDYSSIYANVTIGSWVAPMVIIPLYNVFYDTLGSYIPGMVLAIVFLSLVVFCGLPAIKAAKALTWEE